MISRKNIFIATTIGVLLFGLLLLLGSKYCSAGDTLCGHIDSVTAALLIFVPACFFALAAFIVNDKIFRPWAFWTIVFVPLYIILVLATPRYSSMGGWGIPSIEPRDIIIYFSPILFVIVSALIFLIMALHSLIKKPSAPQAQSTNRPK